MTLSMVFISLTASAWDSSIDAKITDIVMHASGSYRIVFDRNVCGSATLRNNVSVNNGENVGGFVWNPDGMDRVLSVAMSARISGATVHVYAMNGGTGPYCKLGALQLR